MKTKILIASFLAAFSVQSFATMTVECNASAKLASGTKVNISLITNSGYGDNDLASPVDIRLGKAINSDEVAISFDPSNVNKFTNSEKKLLIQVKEKKAKKNSLLVQFDKKTNKGSIELDIDGLVIKSNNLKCNEE